MKQLSLALAVAIVAAPIGTLADDSQNTATMEFKMHPIGHVRKSEDQTLIVIDKEYEPGLLGLEGFSHVYVFWWFDRNDTAEKRATLQVHPRGDRLSFTTPSGGLSVTDARLTQGPFLTRLGTGMSI